MSQITAINMPDIWQPFSIAKYSYIRNPFKKNDQIQNGRLSAIIDFNLRIIWKTVSDS